MKLRVKRLHFLDKCTIGKLYVDDEDVGIFTLEDKYREVEGKPVQEWKVPDETAIPKGTYKVTVDYSDHFQRLLPHVLDVPGYVGVRIHPGNTDLDTEGCLLLGKEWSGGDFVGKSREAFQELFPRIQGASECSLEIT